MKRSVIATITFFGFFLSGCEMVVVEGVYAEQLYCAYDCGQAVLAKSSGMYQSGVATLERAVEVENDWLDRVELMMDQVDIEKMFPEFEIAIYR